MWCVTCGAIYYIYRQVSDRWTLKVSDFGLSRFKAASVMTGQCGTYQWMAPEVIASQHYNEKAVRDAAILQSAHVKAL